jgi:hypothetical protein
MVNEENKDVPKKREKGLNMVTSASERGEARETRERKREYQRV